MNPNSEPNIGVIGAQSTIPNFIEPSPMGSILFSLALDDRDLSDHLVVTFAKAGAVACDEMIDGDSTSKLLYDLEVKGQNVREPSLMGIACEDGTARRIFVTPCPGDNFRDYAIWVGLVTDTISNLKVRKVAIYPCPGALVDGSAFELTSQLVRSLIESNSVDQVAFIVGRYNYNKLLNLALDLKNEMRSNETQIYIQH